MTNVSIIESIDLFEYAKFNGYKINTSSGPINIKISNEQNCCELWSVYSSLKNMDSLCGAIITNITYLIVKNKNENDDFIITIEVKIEYSLNGVGDSFVVYLKNEHNGYYPHECVLNWEVYIDGVLTTFSTIEEI